MAKSKSKKYAYLETWNTRYGTQTRIVTRQDGRFIDSTPALETMRKAPTVSR